MKMHSFSANQRGVIFTFTLLIDEHELYAYKTHSTESSRHIHALGIYFEQALLWGLLRILSVFLCISFHVIRFHVIRSHVLLEYFIHSTEFN